MWWLGPVRFGSFPRPVPSGSTITRFGSVRFGSAGSVRLVRFGFLVLPERIFPINYCANSYRVKRA